ncbi:hypothetical protein INT47_010758 [Mucor saturninus]|uniref:Uncharacterized protein n=1 Tax=Mucor saturninus TaxID=64648 RepID=A0A8H7V079_9FUNG|nr:hypothetical protein INT47_010758 [Mucor saturninus]
MALGGGVLLFNSLYTLLPASQQKLNSNFFTYLCFFAGVVFTFILTLAIQSCTPRALHTCDPIGTVAQHSKPHTHSIKYGTLPNNHQQVTDRNDYFLIGIQTAIAICIHKFPEGLIMFVSNQSSSELGLSVAAAIIIHNFIEGFLIALPLYYATDSRLSAFGYASFLGGMSQPLGAILGLCVIRNVEAAEEQLLFGMIFGVVSGMMCLIAIQVLYLRNEQ